jgi:tRNA1(Val) A37 N6-methylase TrmN6
MYDTLWPGGPRFLIAEGGFKLSTDSVLLAHFTAKLRAGTIFDLGCGAGVLTVLLGLSHPAAKLEGIELQPEAAALCRRNLEENGLDPGGILTGDLRSHRALLKAGAYDLVVANPPYFAAGSGYSAPDPARAAAREEQTCTLTELCAAAGYLCRWGGAFALVHRPERLAEVFGALLSHGLEPKRLRFVQYDAQRPPSLALIEARRGGKPGLTVEAPLLLTGPDGGDSEEVKEIYHMG